MGEAKRRKQSGGGETGSMESQLGLIAVGGKFPYGPLEEGVSIVFGGGNAPVFVASLSDLAESEIRGARRDRIRVGFLPYGEHTCFFMLSIPSLSDAWMDAPFALGRVSPEHREFPEIESERHGYFCTLCLVERSDEVVKALRGFTVSPDVTRAVASEIERQRAGLDRYSEAAHAEEVRWAYQEMPHPNDMAKRAEVVETAGSKAVFGQGGG